MVHAKGVTIGVIVDGASLKEYDEHTTNNALSSGTCTSCYVESEIGKCFEIQTTCDDSAFSGYKIFSVAVSVDGTFVSKTILTLGKHQTSLIIGPKGKVKGKWSVQPMMFADLKLDEADTADNVLSTAEGSLSSLGLITVKLWRASGKRRVRSSKAKLEIKDPVGTDTVSEKALKGQALDTHTKLGKVSKTHASRFYKTNKVDDKEKPYLTFNIMYRSLNALQSMSIIPRTPSPVPEPPRPIASFSTEELIASLSREDMIGVLERRAAQSSLQSKVKSEVKTNLSRGPVKRERDEELVGTLASAQSPGKKARKPKVEVIDLLDY